MTAKPRSSLVEQNAPLKALWVEWVRSSGQLFINGKDVAFILTDIQPASQMNESHETLSDNELLLFARKLNTLFQIDERDASLFASLLEKLGAGEACHQLSQVLQASTQAADYALCNPGTLIDIRVNEKNGDITIIEHCYARSAQQAKRAGKKPTQLIDSKDPEAPLAPLAPLAPVEFYGINVHTLKKEEGSYKSQPIERALSVAEPYQKIITLAALSLKPAQTTHNALCQKILDKLFRLFQGEPNPKIQQKIAVLSACLAVITSDFADDSCALLSQTLSQSPNYHAGFFRSETASLVSKTLQLIKENGTTSTTRSLPTAK